MSNWKSTADDNDSVGELQDLEVLDPIEDDFPKVPDVPEEKASDAVSFPPLTNLYENSFFPVLFIDKTMKILFANKACENLFTGFFRLPGRYFVDVFGKSFGIDYMRKIHTIVREGKNGYFWKGEVRIKSRQRASVQIKVYIFPSEINGKAPQEFVVMFDDITEEKKKATRSLFMSLLEASKLKDNDTGNHIVRVNFYSRRLAEELFKSGDARYKRIDADFIDSIGFLAAMHDVGKIGTPDDILNKEGPLSDWEWTVMREHTKNGAFILSTYPNPMAKEIALAHHERWDGSGYPYQLSGEMIPLAARIVTVADVYDALRMERSYKRAMSHKVTVYKMLEGRETHFDPFLVDIFSSIEKDFSAIYDDNLDEKREYIMR